MSSKVEIQAIIQARMGSTRLPGKVLEIIGGKTILEWVVERLRGARLVERVVLATTTGRDDDRLAETALRDGISLFRGDDEDVLDRFCKALKEYPADTVVRATADNPLLDMGFMETMIEAHIENKADHTGVSGKAPLGAAAEIVSSVALDTAWKEANAPAFREHVTPYIYSNPQKFHLLKVAPPSYLCGRDYRFTVDTKKDMELMKKIFSILNKAGRPFDAMNATALLDGSPKLARINKGVRQKDWQKEL